MCDWVITVTTPEILPKVVSLVLVIRVRTMFFPLRESMKNWTTEVLE